MVGDGPSISIIIPALDASRTIGRCLAALDRQSLPRECFEVIVVDDGSTDDTAELARRRGAIVMRLARNVGPAAARNAGLAAARGDLIVFTDADCEPADNFVAALTAELHDAGVGGAKGAYTTRQRSLVARFVQHEYESRYRRASEQTWIDFVDTYAACFRRADLERVGGFDPRFRVCEDQELSFRLAEAGLRIRFVPAARTAHLHTDRLGPYLRKKFRIAWWKVAVLRRHPGKAVRDSHTPQALKLEIPLAYASLVALLTTPVLARVGLRRRWWAAAAAPALAHLCLSAAFSVRVFRADPAVAVVAPVVLFLRDLALGAGLVLGILRGPCLAPCEPVLITPAGARAAVGVP
jgi:cellulose synthase/poly-beta-1,6-N-acetylglucosamine synthase-like glycosyltransferase